MKTAFNDDEIAEAYTMARAEAKAAFPSDVVYMEKYLQHPRHIEMQVLADKYGNVVHLGERDCSIQRNHQKVIEECPSPALNQSQRKEIGDIVCNAIKKIGYQNAGTLEFMFEDGKFYFLEMNTRLQVEHPITEAVSGIDIVKEQIRIASGAALGYNAVSMRKIRKRLRPAPAKLPNGTRRAVWESALIRKFIPGIRFRRTMTA